MRRVQRFYMAQTPLNGTMPAWKVFAHINERMKGGSKPKIAPNVVMREITQHVLRYGEMDYASLARVEPQFPKVGGEDLYYGGTAYANRGGLGIQWATNAEKEKYSVKVLFDREPLFAPSAIMHHRIPEPYAELNADDAAELGIADGDQVILAADGVQVVVKARVNGKSPLGAVLLPQHLNSAPVPVALATCTVEKMEE